MERILANICLEDIDDWYAENFEDFVDCIDYEIAVEEFEGGAPLSRVIVETVLYRIPALGLTLREGIYENWDEEINDFTADWSLTAIYEGDGVNAEELVYYEQDGLGVSLYNFLYATSGGSFTGDENVQITVKSL